MPIFEFSKQCYHQVNAQHYSKRRHPIKTMAPANILLNTDKRKADLAINWLAILAVNVIYEGGKVCTKAGKEEPAAIYSFPLASNVAWSASGKLITPGATDSAYHFVNFLKKQLTTVGLIFVAS